MDIYEALVHLQYPKITLVNLKDVESEILSGENRVYLLSWLLQQNPKFTFPLLSKLKGPALEGIYKIFLEELFKYYSQIGICKEKEKLFGTCSFKNQLSTLKLLLLFMKNINGNHRTEEETDKANINDILQEYFENPVNILPADFTISTKLSQAETIKYIEETRKSADDIRTMISESNDQLLESKSESSTEEKLQSIQDVKNEKYKPSLEKFTESFMNLENGPNTQRPLQNSFQMNDIISSMESNFSSIKQALSCKDDILKLSIQTELQTFDAPLTEAIDDSIFLLQRVSNVQAEENDF